MAMINCVTLFIVISMLHVYCQAASTRTPSSSSHSHVDNLNPKRKHEFVEDAEDAKLPELDSNNFYYVYVDEDGNEIDYYGDYDEGSGEIDYEDGGEDDGWIWIYDTDGDDYDLSSTGDEEIPEDGYDNEDDYDQEEGDEDEGEYEYEDEEEGEGEGEDDSEEEGEDEDEEGESEDEDEGGEDLDSEEDLDGEEYESAEYEGEQEEPTEIPVNTEDNNTTLLESTPESPLI